MSRSLAAGEVLEAVVEQPLHLAARQAVLRRQLLDVDVAGEACAHVVEDGGELGVAHAEFGGNRKPLLVAFAARHAMEAHLGHLGGEPRAVVLLDQRHEEVDPGIAAAAGDDLPVTAVDLVGDRKLGEDFLEGRLVLPVQREALALREGRRAPA